MYIVIDKITKELLWKNPAPLKQQLKDKQVWYYYNPEIHQIIECGALPEYWKIENDKIVEMSLQDKVNEGIIIITEFQKVEDKEIVNKTNEELLADGLLTQEEYDTILEEQEQLQIQSELATTNTKFISAIDILIQLLIDNNTIKEDNLPEEILTLYNTRKKLKDKLK